MKNIAIVVPNLAGSGGEKIALVQAKMFYENGYNVVLFLLEDLKTYDISELNFSVEYLSKFKNQYKIFGKLGYKFYAFLLKSKMKKYGNFDLILSNLPRADRVVKELKHCNKVFVIHMSYKAELEKFSNRVASKKLKLYKYLYENEKLITVSKAIIEDLDNLKIKYKNVMTIYNPFYFEEIIKKGNEQVEYNFDYIISPSAYRLQKRYDVMLDAFKLLENKMIKLLILSKENQKLTSMIEERGLEERVLVIGFKQNPYKYINNAKLLILSSDREGLPTVVIESLILSTPVVSTDCPTGPKEIMINELSKWLVPVNNPNELAKKIDEALISNIKIDKIDLSRFNQEKIFIEYESLCNI